MQNIMNGKSMCKWNFLPSVINWDVTSWYVVFSIDIKLLVNVLTSTEDQIFRNVCV